MLRRFICAVIAFVALVAFAGFANVTTGTGLVVTFSLPRETELGKRK